MVQYHNGKPWCEVCDQGFIRHVRVNKLNLEAYVCEECDAMWMTFEDIGNTRICDLLSFTRERGLPWNWDELTLLDKALYAGDQ